MQTKLGKLIQDRRREMRLSQAELGSMVGLSAPAIGKIERGETMRPNSISVFVQSMGLSEETLNDAMEEDFHNLVEASNRAAGWMPPMAPSKGPIGRSGPPEPSFQRWFDAVKAPMLPGLDGEMVPVLGRASAGRPGSFTIEQQALEWTPTPVELRGVHGAYVLYVYGDSMIPRYYPGEKVHVNPNRPVGKGDFCVVQIGDDGDVPGEGYIKQFVSNGDVLVLHQFNPDKDITFNRNQVKAIHLIVGSSRA